MDNHELWCSVANYDNAKNFHHNDSQIARLVGGVGSIGTALKQFAALDDDVVDDAVGLRLLCSEPTVAL
jgi:hypothetical protein